MLRPGEPVAIEERASLFLLVRTGDLVLFDVRPLLDLLHWASPDLLTIRLHDGRDRGYREYVMTDSDGFFREFRRDYGGPLSRSTRIALTADPDVARVWLRARDAVQGWRLLRECVERRQRIVRSVVGSVFVECDDADEVAFANQIVTHWRRPDATIGRLARAAGAWSIEGETAVVPHRLVGGVWVGAGRRLERSAAVIGPAVLWDEPDASTPPDDLHWGTIEALDDPARPVRVRRGSSFQRGLKRGFDIAFSLLVLAVVAPLFPLIMIAIWLEDGRPFFFAHRRETLGGEEFGCLKFRSMRKDAEKIKRQLLRMNQADGPQFFIQRDPRLTRVGRIIRAAQLDELPQFINVLLGHMSVVGPRPSPRGENQYCPSWREARLSVRPGITGLWQVRRTRRPGLDFQEWIKFDLEYVERGSWWLDLMIIWKTIRLVLRGTQA